ncbi:MAG: cysteine methyltransferase [Chthonomonadales bacterium]|nr:cysteine methyltransferase [Chthonomonadales bacterium]
MGVKEDIFAVVRTIPRGMVLSYGQVAEMLPTGPMPARIVGQIMAQSPPDVPWQRVVARDGTLAIAKRSPAMAAQQRQLLESEGVTFDPAGRVNMDRHCWQTGGFVGGLFDDE